MEGFSVKTTDIRFVKDSHLFVKDYSISVVIFEINELQHLRGTKRTHFLLKYAPTPSNTRFHLLSHRLYIHCNRVAGDPYLPSYLFYILQAT